MWGGFYAPFGVVVAGLLVLLGTVNFLGLSKISYFPAIYMSLLLALGLTFLGRGLAVKLSREVDFNSPYECGFDPKHSARVPFSLRFFLVAIIFVLFDVEVALLFPTPFLVSMLPGQVVVCNFVVLMLLLLGGLLHEWHQGALDWV